MAFKALADDSSVIDIEIDGGILEVRNELDGIVLVADAKLRANAQGRAAAAKLIETLQGLIDAGDVDALPFQAAKSVENPFG